MTDTEYKLTFGDLRAALARGECPLHGESLGLSDPHYRRFKAPCCGLMISEDFLTNGLTPVAGYNYDVKIEIDDDDDDGAPRIVITESEKLHD